jgi:hypothetical protein
LKKAAGRKSKLGLDHAGNHYVAVRGVQEPQLHDDEEQKETLGSAGDQEVLQYVPETHRAQGSQVGLGVPGAGPV